jgi:hypothetical protein
MDRKVRIIAKNGQKSAYLQFATLVVSRGIRGFLATTNTTNPTGVGVGGVAINRHHPPTPNEP